MPYVIQESLAGQFLVAMPALSDPNFALTVTYICVHNRDGAFGLVINQVFDSVKGKTLFDQMDIPAGNQADSLPVYIGGPVHQGYVFVLHGPPLDWKASLPVSDTVAMSNSVDILQSIASGVGPEPHMLILGCAGWAPGQLEVELAENSWLTCPGDDEILFHTPVGERWEKAVKSIGVDLTLMSGAVGHA
ncbi:MAG: YqgE/AlgH family protein [Desulfatibacillum sp.]|nr:YqgE/AlgH family protein [Desulfatibacillum sp.]